MKRAIFPGSFDPLTKGHEDIIKRASTLFDELIVVILDNSQKASLFSVEERFELLKQSLGTLSNVTCMVGSGCTVDFAKKHDACAIVRGVRSFKDYEYEIDIASVNHHLNANIETIFLQANHEYAFVSSSIIREMMKYNQDISAFVSREVYQGLKDKYKD